MTIALLNTSILTEYGIYRYSPADTPVLKDLLKEHGFKSYIGHQSAADIIGALLEIDCPVSREQYSQEPGDLAVIFKLNGRPPEGVILSQGEIEKIGYSFGTIKRIE